MNDDLNWQDSFLYEGWTIRGKDPIRHKVRTECSEWSVSRLREYASNTSGNQFLVAESFDRKLLVQTSFLWYGYFETVSATGVIGTRGTFEEAIKLHNKTASRIIKQIDEIDELVEAGASALVYDGWL